MNPKLLCLSITLSTLLLAGSSPLRGGDVAMETERYLVTTKRTELLDNRDGKIVTVKSIEPSKILKLSPILESQEELSKRYWFVAISGSEESVETTYLIPRDSAFDLTEARAMGLKALPKELELRTLKAVYSIPLVIQVADPKILNAWKEIAPIIEWNDRQPFGQQLPEPYFVQGQLWTAVGGHSDALRCYLQAASAIRSTGKPEDLVRYANLLPILEKALLQEANLPGTPIVDGARPYWARGVGAYRVAKFSEALDLFTDATRLEPSQASYWYCLALTYLATGDNQLAEKFARIGSVAEWRKHWQRGDIDRDLTKFQGANRTWLEKFRSGSGEIWRRAK